MGFIRYGPDELPAAVWRTVRWRWPGESLLLIVPCDAEWAERRLGWGGYVDDTNSIYPYRDETRLESGLLGVTDARIVYQSRSRPGIWLRIAAATFGFVAAATFLAGDEPMAFVLSGLLAVAAWLAARVVEALGVGGGSIPFGGIVEIDRLDRRIHGVDRWGIHYRLRLAQPDLDRVTRLLPEAA